MTLPDFGTPGRFRADPRVGFLLRRLRMNGSLATTSPGDMADDGTHAPFNTTLQSHRPSPIKVVSRRGPDIAGTRNYVYTLLDHFGNSVGPPATITRERQQRYWCYRVRDRLRRAGITEFPIR